LVFRHYNISHFSCISYLSLYWYVFTGGEERET
jgi:hypothetical protein